MICVGHDADPAERRCTDLSQCVADANQWLTTGSRPRDGTFTTLLPLATCLRYALTEPLTAAIRSSTPRSTSQGSFKLRSRITARGGGHKVLNNLVEPACLSRHAGTRLITPHGNVALHASWRQRMQ